MNRPAPKKSLGQNFLVDRNVAAKIVREFAPAPGDVVVEIGPGQGALTDLLVETGCRLVAVELDPRMSALVIERHGTGVEVMEEDFLNVDLRAVAARHGVEKVRVIGNIPYYITSPILFHLIDQRQAVADATVMMQREVADRLVAVPRSKEYGILSVMVQSYGAPRVLLKVGPGCFFPPPKVTSAVVRIGFRDAEGLAGIESQHRSVVRAAFNQRRKTLRNSLATLIPSQEQRDSIFRHAGIGPNQRAEELSRDDFIRLAGVVAATRAAPETEAESQETGSP